MLRLVIVLLIFSFFVTLIDSQGTYERYESAEFVYQFPSTRNVKGIVLLAHGCQHSATDWWFKSETCLKCIGLPVERMIVADVLNNNMIALSISSSDRDSKCWRGNDESHVERVLRYFSHKHLKSLRTSIPLYTFGASSGGAFVGIFSQVANQLKINVAGTIIQISSLHLIQESSSAKISIPSPVVFIHMPKDEMTAELVAANGKQLIQSNIKAIDFQAQPKPLHAKYFTYAQVLTEEDSKKFFDALKAAGYLTKELLLLNDPRQSDWRKIAVKAINPVHDTLQADLSPLSELMNVAWAAHEITQEYFVEALRWIRQNRMSSSISSTPAAATCNDKGKYLFLDVSCAASSSSSSLSS